MSNNTTHPPMAPMTLEGMNPNSPIAQLTLANEYSRTEQALSQVSRIYL